MAADPRWVTEFFTKLLDADEGAATLLSVILGVVGAIFATLWQLYKHLSDRTAMRKHRTPIDREFPEANYRQRRQILCNELRDHLDRIDSETNWSHHHFVPLDAEVEVQKGDRKRRRLMDLFAGIQTNRRSHLFLILGDPGSGKSVALRKLCRDLLSEVNQTGKIPVYVNLREWSDSSAWTRQSLPTEAHEAQLRKFLLHNVRAQVSHRSRGFLDSYFERMLDNGRLFVILDSFDEIPRVMDVDEASWLIKELSQVIEKTLVGGDKGRAVVASRSFRHPCFTREDVAVLEIRPFNDLKIATAVDRATEHADAIKRALFAERSDLAPLARNPFTLGLMVDFCHANPRQLPKTQADLYEDFVARRLELADEELRERSLDQGDVLRCASSIAFEMFGSDQYGLEIPIIALRERLLNLQVDAVVDFLVAAHLGRRGAQGGTFSFSHRRFQEYFLIKNFREGVDELPLEAIPTDGRWRDALVLFVEVANTSVAKSIASFCWGEILGLKESGVEAGSVPYLRGLHSLRFLATAFRSRKDLLVEFEPELSALIYHAIVSQDDMLLAKHGLETTGVLSDKNAEDTICAALGSANAWFVETAFRACRYLAVLPIKTKSVIIEHLFRLPLQDHMRTYAELMLSLRIAESLRLVKTLYHVKHWELLISLFVLIAVAVLVPGFFLAALICLSPVLFLATIGGFAEEFLRGGRTPYIARLLSQSSTRARDPLYLLHGVLLMAWLAPSTVFACIFWYRLLPGCQKIINNEVAPLLVFIMWNPILDEGVNKSVAFLFSYLLITLFVVRPINVLLHGARFGIKAGAYGVWESLKIQEEILWFWPLAFLLFGGSGYLLYLLFGQRGVESAGISVIGIIVIFGIVMGIVMLYRGLRDVQHDSKVLARAKLEFRGARAQIESVFLSFRTGLYRLKYARWLYTHSEPFRDILASSENCWLGGHRPNVDSDEGSILLAQLDEQWLGLDR